MSDAVTAVTSVTGKSHDRRGEVLDRVERFLSRYVSYPGEHERVAHVLWIGHTHLMHCWDSTPRIAFLSPEPGSGKSRALEVTEPLVPRPVHAVNATPAYLFRKVSDPAGSPTILFDEVDTIFGPRAKDNEDLRGLLNAGHRRGAMAGRCVIRGKEILTEELPAYAAVALAGLNDLPDTIATRSVIVRMRRRAPGERIEPWRLRTCGPAAYELGESLAGWAASVEHEALDHWPDMPDGVEDRNADVWESLLTVADLAGGQWPERARTAAAALVAVAQSKPPTIGIMLLADIRRVLDERGTDRISTEELLNDLNAMDESPWGNIRGSELDSRGLARRLTKYEIGPRVIRHGEGTIRGYARGDFADAWARYLAPLPPSGSVTTVTSETPGHVPAAPVTAVTDVTHKSQDRRAVPSGPERSQDQTASCIECGNALEVGAEFGTCTTCRKRWTA